MPGTIRLIDPSGTIRDVPEDAAAGALDSGWRVPFTKEELARTTEQAGAEAYGGVGGAVKAGLAAGARGLSLGGSDVLARAIGGEDTAIAIEGYREAHPYVSTGAEIVGSAAPIFFSGGAATPAGAVGRLGAGISRTVEGASTLTKLGRAALGGATEGALYGAGTGVSELALSDEPLTIERVGSSLSSNMLFGAGLGVGIGTLAKGAEIGLGRAKRSVDGFLERRANKATNPTEAILQGDLESIDGRILNAAEKSELERIHAEQAPQRQALTDDLDTWRKANRDTHDIREIAAGSDNPNLREASGAFDRANFSLRAALDDKVGFADDPLRSVVPVRKQGQALEDMRLAAQAQERAWKEAVDTAPQRFKQMIRDQAPESSVRPRTPGRDAAPMSDDEYAAYKKSWGHAADTHYEHEMFYSKGGDEIVNPELRSGKPLSAPAKKLRDGLDAAFREPESRIPRELTLYRGLSDDPLLGKTGVKERFANVKPGDVLDDPAYTSTAYSAKAKSRNEEIVFTISAPAGTPALPLRTHFTSEGEMLLPRGTKMRVDSIELVPVTERWDMSGYNSHERLPDGSVRLTTPDGSVSVQPPIKDIHVTVISEHAPVPARPVVDLDSAPLDKLSTRQLAMLREEFDQKFQRMTSGSPEYNQLLERDNALVARRRAISEKEVPDPPDYAPHAAPAAAPRAAPRAKTIEIPGEIGPFSEEGLNLAVERALKEHSQYAFQGAWKHGLKAPSMVSRIPKIDAMIEANAKLRARLEALARPPESELLSKIAEARAVLATPKAPSPGAAIAAAVIPFAGSLGAAAATGNRVLGSLKNMVSAATERGAKAVSALLGLAEKGAAAGAPYAPVVAVKVLSAVRFDGTKHKDDPDDLYEAYKRATDAIKSQIAVTPDGQYQLRPSAREKMAASFNGIRPAAPILADRLEEHAARRIEYLAGEIPRKPDVFALHSGGPDTWRPSTMEMAAFARKVAAVEDPHAMLDRLAHGEVTPEDSAAIRAVYPELMRDITEQVTSQMHAVKALAYNKKIALSIFTGQPADPSLDPKVIAALQSMYPNEPGSQGGAQTPRAEPSFGAMKSATVDAADARTPAQERAA